MLHICTASPTPYRYLSMAMTSWLAHKCSISSMHYILTIATYGHSISATSITITPMPAIHNLSIFHNTSHATPRQWIASWADYSHGDSSSLSISHITITLTNMGAISILMIILYYNIHYYNWQALTESSISHTLHIINIIITIVVITDKWEWQINTTN